MPENRQFDFDDLARYDAGTVDTGEKNLLEVIAGVDFHPAPGELASAVMGCAMGLL
ncbi:MAG: hypothetical protein HQL89_18725 [Magnetococcales bacterium]|nr:hypothetical protein [Magnetococcales bacterium]